MYTTTINQNGLILLNKAARDALGVKLGDRVVISIDKEQARVEREMTDEEFVDGILAIHDKYHGTASNAIDADSAVRQYREGKNSKVNNYYKEKYS